jgi:hypothetical protein
VVSRRALAALGATLGLGLGCNTIIDKTTSSFDTTSFSGDPYPISVDTSSGAIVLGLGEDTHTGIRTAVLDVLSPLTIADRGVDAPVRVDESNVTIYGVAGDGTFATPRARFAGKSVATLHPCDLETQTCTVGPVDNPRPFDAVLGMDAFSGDALRIRRAANEIQLFPDIAGDDEHRTRACDAVFPSTFRGGGTLVLGGTEIDFPNRRIAIDTCMAPNPDADTQSKRGVDALFVLSTAIDISLINESTYAHYLDLDPTAPALDALPEQMAQLPSGPVAGRATTLPSLALVGNLPSNPRAPCRQVYAHHLLTDHSCIAGDDCPCTNGNSFCPVPAVVELAGSFPVLVVSDSDPTLLALRAELRPDRPEVNGILGLSALDALELDVDYPHGRALMRCTDRTSCAARVTLTDDASRDKIHACLE